MGKQLLPEVAIFEVCYWEYILTLTHSYAEVSLNLPKMWMLCTRLHLWHYEGEEDSQLGLILLYKTILSLKLLLALPVRERLQNHVVFIQSHMLRNFHQVLVCNCDEWWVQFLGISWKISYFDCCCRFELAHQGQSWQCHELLVCNILNIILCPFKNLFFFFCICCSKM